MRARIDPGDRRSATAEAGLSSAVRFGRPPRIVRRARLPRGSPGRIVTVIALLLTSVVLATGPASAGPVTVALGAAESFSVLGGGGVTSTGPTDVSADLGAHTAISVVGFPPGVVHGATHLGDTTSAQAFADLQLAYDDAAARAPDTSLAGDLNGVVLGPGVYRASAAIAITGTLTLDGGGDPNAVFIFQFAAAFNPAASSTINLVGGASATNVFWQVQGAVGIGALAAFSGTILTPAAITIGAGATLTGRALSTVGAITLSANTIASPGATAGALSITVPPGPVDLGTYADAASARTIAGTLGTIRVDDTRGGSAATGWVATVTSTSFTPPAGPPIPPTAISYSTGPLAQIRGHAAHARHDATDLSTAAAVVTVTGASGDNAAVTSWTPSIAIIVPDTAVAGIYTATITHSVL